MIHLLQPATPVIEIQFYWLTIVFIGWSLLKAIIEVSKGKFVRNYQTLPLAAKFLISVATSFSLFGVLTTIGYAFKLPSWWLGFFYFSSLAIAFVYSVARFRRRTYKNLPLSELLQTYRSLGIFSPFNIMLLLIIVDLGFHFFIGSLIGADGFIHVSKIRHLATNGFTLTDAYYGTVPETRHTISVMHTLVAVPSWLGINPITSWYASEVFFRLVKLSAIFYLGWRLLERVRGGRRLQYASLIVIMSLALFNNYIIAYPALFVTAFIIMFMIALMDVLRGYNHWLLIMASALIAWTHPLDSVAMFIFLGIVIVGLALFNRRIFTLKFMLTALTCFVLLISTPIFVSTLPNRMTNDVKNYGLNQLSFISLGSHKALRPSVPDYFDTDSFTALPWTVEALSIIGIVGLLAWVKNRSYRIIIGSAVIYPFLVLYNPIAFSLLRRELPAWSLARFNAIDQFVLVFCFFGLLSICLAVNRVLRSKIKNLILPALFLATMIIFVFTQSFGSVDPKSHRHDSMYAQQVATYGNLDQLSHVLPDDKNAIVMAEQTMDSFMIPVVAPLRIVAINEFNSTPAADMTDRLTCSNLLYYYLQPSLLKQANASYVLTQRSDTAFYERALLLPQLKPIKQNDRWVLFKFDSSSVVRADNPACNFLE